ncbi:MAG: phosphoribosylformylglycinamidine synthase I [Candidatus Omnitrophica bacterium]|nr:phosphoribosylformylglycinamidine synthase I [Candidatus Omnitrophota bacterium]
MIRPKVCVLRTAGTNCDKETAFAFKMAGGSVELVHINKIVSGQACLEKYHILALPGGFSYGDDISSGKIFANELKYKLRQDIEKFILDGKLIIGICNGFQVLVKSGILPGDSGFEQKASLILNDSAKFEDRWVYLKSHCRRGATLQTKCVWTKNLPEIIYLPVAHGEGKFVVKDNTVLNQLNRNNQIVFQYCDNYGRLSGYPFNPNGSQENIAGICDKSGRVFGLMPHPERHAYPQQHPRWTAKGNKKTGDGFQIFRNGVEYARKMF